MRKFFSGNIMKAVILLAIIILAILPGIFAEPFIDAYFPDIDVKMKCILSAHFQPLHLLLQVRQLLT